MTKRTGSREVGGAGFFVSRDVAAEVVAVRTSVAKPPSRATMRARESMDGSANASKLRRIVTELESTGPGSEFVYLESLRAMGPRAIEALGEAFPGVLWFDRELPFQRVPRGRDTSAVASLLYALGESAHATIAGLLRARHADVRYYAVLLAIDVGPALFADALAECAEDGDEEIAELASAALAAVRSGASRR